MTAKRQTLIVDDEPLARERLQRLMGRLDLPVCGEACNGLEALKQVESLNPDVVILDVQMPQMDGFETARHLNRLESPPLIVFCTAYDEHALKAFEASAVDYLVKPVRVERLQMAFDKLAHYQREPIATVSSQGQRQHLCARIGNSLKLIAIDQIYYCRAEHKYVTVVHQGGESLVEEALVSLEEEFEDAFLRIHRNTLVNRKQILGLRKQTDSQTLLTLKDSDSLLEISRRNLPQIRKLIRSI